MITPEIGTIIHNRFRVLSLLGVGGQGPVYHAADTQAGDRDVALKVVNAYSEHSVALARAAAEYAVLAKLSHPNIVRVYDAGHLPEGGWYIAMEYVAGATLDAKLNELGRIPFPEALHILHNVALGLEAAHQQNVIHRDLKPKNILLGDDGRIVLLDFGLARDMVDGHSMTDTGHPLGTWMYMSPEQIRREHGKKLDERTDIYAFGIVAHQIVAGEPPFAGTTPMQVFQQHLESPPPRLAPKEYGVPEWYGNLAGVCLQKRPSDRFQSMTEIRTLLEKRMRQMGLLEGPVERTNPVAAFFLRFIGEQ